MKCCKVCGEEGQQKVVVRTLGEDYSLLHFGGDLVASLTFVSVFDMMHFKKTKSTFCLQLLEK